MKKLVIGGLIAAIVVAAAAFGAGLAAAAEPAAPAPPPVPVVFQPLDASQGLLGIERGTMPAVATPDLSQMPAAGVLPGLQLDMLPTKAG